MKVSYFELDGERHPLCFSLVVGQVVEERFGDIVAMNDAMTGGGRIFESVEVVLSAMLRAGRKEAQRRGDPLPAELTDLADRLDINDLKRAEAAIFATIDKDAARQVEAEPKNEVTTGTEAGAPRGSTTTAPAPD